MRRRGIQPDLDGLQERRVRKVVRGRRGVSERLLNDRGVRQPPIEQVRRGERTEFACRFLVGLRRREQSTDGGVAIVGFGITHEFGELLDEAGEVRCFEAGDLHRDGPPGRHWGACLTVAQSP